MMRILLDGTSMSSKSEMTLDKLTKDFKWECICVDTSEIRTVHNEMKLAVIAAR